MIKLHLQRFADSGGQGGNMVATTTNFVNAYTGSATSWDAAHTMSPEMKTWYNTEALENSRPNLVHAQFAKNIPLPPNNGTTVEVRKPNTMPDVQKLTEGVIPDGRKYGYTNLTASVYQYGDYAAVSDRLALHAIDPVAQDITEEFGAAGGNTKDKLARNIAEHCPGRHKRAVLPEDFRRQRNRRERPQRHGRHLQADGQDGGQGRHLAQKAQRAQVRQRIRGHHPPLRGL